MLKLARAPFALVLLAIGVAAVDIPVRAWFEFKAAREASRRLERVGQLSQRVQDDLKQERERRMLGGYLASAMVLPSWILFWFISKRALRGRNQEFLLLRWVVWASFMWIGAGVSLLTLVIALMRAR